MHLATSMECLQDMGVTCLVRGVKTCLSDLDDMIGCCHFSIMPSDPRHIACDVAYLVFL